jgi:DNA invertase Pin-like site-specific DNA recombinase
MALRARVVAYVRVSTDKQVEQGLSLEAQQAKLTAYAALYELDLVAVEVDAGVSAKTLQRPALQRALTRLKAREAEALLVVKLDRLTRSVRDLGALVETYFLAGKWSLMSVSEQIDTRTAAGRMVLHILAAVSQWERETIAERTAEAMAYKCRQREYTGGEPPYGWQLAADGVHLDPHPDEQAIVREALELKAAGLSLRTIGARLAARGILPRQGRAWNPKTVRDLLQAEVA